MEFPRGKSKLNTTLEGGSSDEDDCKWHWFGTVFGAIAAVAVVAALRILVRMVAGGRSRVTRAVEGVERGTWDGLGSSWCALGEVLGSFFGVLGGLGTPLGMSFERLGSSKVHFGSSWAVLGRSWGIPSAKIAKTP